jgi:hypothetical protein
VVSARKSFLWITGGIVDDDSEMTLRKGVARIAILVDFGSFFWTGISRT